MAQNNDFAFKLKRSTPISIMHKVGNEMVRATSKEKHPACVISRSLDDTDLETLSAIESFLDYEGQLIEDLTIVLDDFTLTERQHISSMIADKCMSIEHLRYKCKKPLQQLERMHVPFLNQIRTLEFLLVDDTTVKYDAFILNHLRYCAGQLETLSFGAIDFGCCLINTRCRPLRHLQILLNEDTYNFLDYHNNLEMIRIFGVYCDMERLHIYLPLIRKLCISFNTIRNIRAISKLRNLTHLEIDCKLPNDSYNEVVNALKGGNMLNIIDLKINGRIRNHL